MAINSFPIETTTVDISSLQETLDNFTLSQSGLHFESQEAASLLDLSSVGDTIYTNGYYESGDGGGATYVRGSELKTGGFIDLAGEYWNPVLTPYVTPEMFGAKANEDTYDSFQAIVSARDALYEEGGGTILLGSHRRYVLSETLEIDPTRITLRGSGYSELDWRLKTFSDPDTATQNITNSSFDEGSLYWSSSANQTVTPTWDDGKVVWTASSQGDYAEFGQQVSTVAGKKYRFRVVTDEITDTLIGVNTFRTIGFSFRPNAVGSGGSGGTLRTVSNQDAQYVGAGSVFEWVVTCPYDDAYLTVQSNGSGGLQQLEVYDYVDNSCIYVQTPADGYMRLHNTNEFANFRLRGTLDTSVQQYVVGMYFDTETATLSSRCVMRGLDIHEGVGIGQEFANRAYLIESHSCRIVATEACIKTNIGSSDAGENITYFGGNIGGGNIGIWNLGGFDLRFFGHSNDFSRQWMVGSDGRVDCYGCHWENSSFSSDQTGTDDQYRIDLSGSAKLRFFGGYMLNGGSSDNLTYASTPMRLSGSSRVWMHNVRHYGLTGADEKIADTSDKAEIRLVECEATSGQTPYVVSDAANEVPEIEGLFIPVEHFSEIPDGKGSVGMSTAEARTGSSSILMAKSDVLGSGTGFTETFLFPLRQGSQVGLSGYWKVPAQANGTFNIFLQTYFVSYLDETRGVLKEQFVSDLPLLSIDSDTGTEWTWFGSRTSRIDASTIHNGFAPAWATHFALRVSMVGAPVGAEFHLDDLHFNQM